MLAPSLLDDRISRTTYDALSRPTKIVGGYRVLGTAGAGNVEIENYGDRCNNPRIDA